MPSGIAGYVNLAAPTNLGRSDYAACGGDNPPSGAVRPQLDPHDASPQESDCRKPHGIKQLRANLRAARDRRLRHAGLREGGQHHGRGTKTIMAGEKNVSTDLYFTGTSLSDCHGWDNGYSQDVVRWATVAANATSSTGPAAQQDLPGADNYNMFGSARDSATQLRVLRRFSPHSDVSSQPRRVRQSL